MINFNKNYWPFRKKRSVLFWRNNYYHFYYLARALRKRGWDAQVVSVDDPKGPFSPFYHGQDIVLYSSDHKQFQKLVKKFISKAILKYKLLHFTGDGYMCLSPLESHLDPCEDIISWRKAGNKIAYTVSGCNSATSQSSVKLWSALDGRIVCNTCPWQNSPEICSDEKNLSWGEKLDKYCDYIFAETLPALDYIKLQERVYREPLSMCLDPDVWSPNLVISNEFLIHKNQDEVLIYHAVGNYEQRTQIGKNIKGTSAIIAAVERLKADGLPVKLIFITGVKNIDIRFIQAQADIIVDQLNIGRYGATAREGMMLGKPVICYINKKELYPDYNLESLENVPLVSATELDIYDILKDLVLNEQKRLEIGHLSRQYALKWLSADVCAERYEKIYDELIQKPTPICYPTEKFIRCP